MKKYALLFTFFIFFFTSAFSQNEQEFTVTMGDTTYHMKRYMFGILKNGPNRTQDSATVAEIQKAHLEHLAQMAKSGKLVMSGPFESENEYRGLLIFDVATSQEAIALESEDPAVKAGRLVLEVIPWWGAKGTTLP